MTHADIVGLRAHILTRTKSKYPNHSDTAVNAITNEVLRHLLTQNKFNETQIEYAYKAITDTKNDDQI